MLRLLSVAAAVASAVAFGGVYQAGSELAYNACEGSSCGEPLLWTPLIKSKQIDVLQDIAAVTGVGSRPSYSGYVTVNETDGANSFVWLWPSLNNGFDAPLIIWLQGGPGGSSLFGMFVENGPYSVDANGNLFDNPGSWCGNYSCLYIDNPRGTGYSYTNNGTLCTEWTCYAADLDNAVRQVLTAFPQLQAQEVYITGESYAGKYVPAFGYQVYTNNNAGYTPKVNLAGIAIGDGFSVPRVMVQGYADLLWQVGMLDDNQWVIARQYQDQIVAAIDGGNNSQAFRIWDSFLNGDLIPYPPWYVNATGVTDYYNINRDAEPASFGNYVPFVTSPTVRAGIHVGNNTYHQDTAVEFALISDFMVTQQPRIETLLNASIRVMIYNGQLDVICGTPLTEAYVPTLAWPGQAGWIASTKNIWMSPVDGTVAGYVKAYANLVQVVVRGAGHILPFDQPARGLDMITRFIEQQPFN